VRIAADFLSAPVGGNVGTAPKATAAADGKTGRLTEVTSRLTGKTVALTGFSVRATVFADDGAALSA